MSGIKEKQPMKKQMVIYTLKKIRKIITTNIIHFISSLNKLIRRFST